ncbi:MULTISPECIES: ABC transporter substrate-binding protein [Anaeromyxobacter]|uniref:ABC transporter substrate-binding protein n=1 Tax=Anaeromyxobacter TaxID=161492 RepID=UPI001F5664D1|nr:MULTISPECIES: ABC transporter substrate-binding protein [unclassified Anaeromyxobacter]
MVPLHRVVALLLALATTPGHGAGGPSTRPVLLALDLEFGHATSTSAEAIRRGALIAAAEVNAKGGVLDGRPLELVTRDNRSVPSRAIENVREVAANPDVVAVMTGKFSPVVEELIPVVHELGIPLLAAWSASDAIVHNGRTPNYVFRLSLNDTWAMEALFRGIERQGLKRVGLVLPNTSWGRSSLAAAERYTQRSRRSSLVATAWYNWGDASLKAPYRTLLAAGAEAVVLVANEGEGSILVKEMAGLPPDERRPLFCHWGLTGGQFTRLAGDALQQVSLHVVQTYSFVGARDPNARRVLRALRDEFGVHGPRAVEAPVGVAHAYDLVHLLARAIDRAGSTDRKAIRRALEQLGEYDGLVKTYRHPFTATRHEALGPGDVFLARFAPDGALVRSDGPVR